KPAPRESIPRPWGHRLFPAGKLHRAATYSFARLGRKRGGGGSVGLLGLFLGGGLVSALVGLGAGCGRVLGAHLLGLGLLGLGELLGAIGLVARLLTLHGEQRGH